MASEVADGCSGVPERRVRGPQPRGPTPWRPPLGSVPEAAGSEKHNAAAFPGERVRISRTHIRHCAPRRAGRSPGFGAPIMAPGPEITGAAAGRSSGLAMPLSPAYAG